MLTSSRPYFFYLDAVRALLMMLGVPYHAARVYGEGRANAVHSPETSRMLDTLAEVSHSFRMEAFFVVAGFLAAMALARTPVQAFLRGRTTRIGVPALFCTVLFAPIGAYLIAAGANNGTPPTSVEVWGMLQTPGSWWVMHLWFLHTLLLLTFCLIGFVLAIQRWPACRDVADALSAVLTWIIGRRFVVAGLGIAAAWVAVWIIPALVRRLFGFELAPFGPFFDLQPVVRFLPMFLFGAAMWARPDILDWMKQRRPLALPMALLGSSIFVLGAQNGPYEGVLIPIGACMAGFFWAQFLIAEAAARFDQPSPTIRYLADASFTIYLVHFPIVLALGLALLDVPWNPVVEFGLVTLATFAISFALHEVIRRSDLLLFLFNGKPMKAR